MLRLDKSSHYSALDFMKEAGVLGNMANAVKKGGKIFLIGEALSAVPGAAAGAHHATSHQATIRRIAAETGAGALASHTALPGGGTALALAAALKAKKRKKE